MLLLLAAVYACMEFRDIFPKGSEGRNAIKSWHYMLGLSVFALVWVRLLVNLVGTAPAITPAPPRWQTLASKWVHAALYLLMIAMPLAGWLTLSAEGEAIPFFGLQLPALIAESKDLAETIKEVHETGAGVGYFLIGLHAAAALFHHYVVRDNTLRQMSLWRT
jgi:cytochrome b561